MAIRRMGQDQATNPEAFTEAIVSRPSISEDRTSAVVFYDFNSGPLSGGGGIVVMRKSEGRWVSERFITSHVY